MQTRDSSFKSFECFKAFVSLPPPQELLVANSTLIPSYPLSCFSSTEILSSMDEPVDPLAAAVPLVERPIAYKLFALCSSPHSFPNSAREPDPNQPPRAAWRNEEELEYVGQHSAQAPSWTDFRIVSFLVETALTIPPKSESRSDPWVTVTQTNGTTTTVPRGYRVPLLWIQRVLWESLKLALTSGKVLWPWIKWDLLHIGRLTNDFLLKARSEVKMKRQWRHPRFDRPMTRFFNGWMGCREVFMWDFYKEFKDLEYQDDILSLRWPQKVPKGIQGFVVTDLELAEGVTADQYMDGLVVDNTNRTVDWNVPPEPEPELPPPPAPASPPPPVAPSHSRGSSPLTSDAGSERELDVVAADLNPKPSEPSTPTPSVSNGVAGPSRPPPLAIQTSELQKPRKKTQSKPRPLRAEGSTGSARPLRPRTQGGSVISSPAVSNSPASGVHIDFTAPVESRGRKRKIETVYSRSGSASPSPLTSDDDDDASGSYRGSSYKGSRGASSRAPSQGQTPAGRSFTTQTRIVIPRLSASIPDVHARQSTLPYGVPTANGNDPMSSISARGPSMASGPSTAGFGSISAGPSSFASENGHQLSHRPSGTFSESTTPRKRTSFSTSSSPNRIPLTQLQIRHEKLSAIASSMSSAPFNPRTSTLPPLLTWRHAEELDYIGPNHPSVQAGEWTDWKIVEYMVENVYTIPSRAVDNKQTWVEVRMINIPPSIGALPPPPTSASEDGSFRDDGMDVEKDPSQGYVLNVPRGYRIPLLWLARVQWECLRYLITRAPEYWNELKYDVLHIARLSGVFLAKARKEPRIKRGYRDVMFDRPLSRFYTGWMGSRDEFVYDFFREFREEEYEDDMLSKRWLHKVQKGIQGFVVTEQEINDGITAEQYMHGLELDRENQTFAWVLEDGQRYTLPAPGTLPPVEPMQVEERVRVPNDQPKQPPQEQPRPQSPFDSPLTPVQLLPSHRREDVFGSSPINGVTEKEKDKHKANAMDIDAVVPVAAAEKESEPVPEPVQPREKSPVRVPTPTPPTPTPAQLRDPMTLFDDPTPESTPEPENRRVQEPPTTMEDPRSLFDSPEPGPPMEVEPESFDPLFDEPEQDASPLPPQPASGHDDLFGSSPLVAPTELPQEAPPISLPPPVAIPDTQSDVPTNDVVRDQNDAILSTTPKSPIVTASAVASIPVPSTPDDGNDGLFVESVASPKPAPPAEDDSESIRSSSSPEPRRPVELPPPVIVSEPTPRDTSRAPSPPPAPVLEQPSPVPSAEEHHASPPPDSEIDEEEPMVVESETVEEVHPVDSVETPREEAEEDDPSATPKEPKENEMRYFVPIAASDAAEDFPPGFHFMGDVPHATTVNGKTGQQEIVPTPDSAPIVTAPTSMRTQSPVFDIDDGIAPVNGRPPSPPTEPQSLGKPTITDVEEFMQSLSNEESRQIKQEVLTDTNLRDVPGMEQQQQPQTVIIVEEDEEPEDMDIGTPIDSPVELEPEPQEAATVPNPVPDAPAVPLPAPDAPMIPIHAPATIVARPEPPAIHAIEIPTPRPQPSPPVSDNNSPYQRSAPAPFHPPQPSNRHSFPNKSNINNDFSYGRNSSYRRPSPPPRSSQGGRPFFSKPTPTYQKPPPTFVPSSRPEGPAFANPAPRSKLFARDREANGGAAPPQPAPPAPPQLAHRPEEYDPRQPYALSGPPTNGDLPPTTYPRWPYPAPANDSDAYYQPYSPLTSFNNQLTPASPHIPHVPATNAITIPPPGVARPPSPLRRSSSHDTMASKPPSPPVHPLPPAEVLRNFLAQVSPEILRGSQLATQINPLPDVEMGEANVPRIQSPIIAGPSSAPHVSRTPPITQSAYHPSVTIPVPVTEAPRVPEIDMDAIQKSILERLQPEMQAREAVTLARLDAEGKTRDASLLERFVAESKSRENAFSERLVSDSQSRESALIARVRQEVRSELREELAAELKEQMYALVRAEIGQQDVSIGVAAQAELKDALRGELKDALRGELEDALRGDLKGALLAELRNELHSDVRVAMRESAASQMDTGLVRMREELPGNIKAVFETLKSDIVSELKSELAPGLQNDLVAPLMVQLGSNLKMEVAEELKGELFPRLRDDLAQHLPGDLRPLLFDDLKTQLREELATSLESQLRDVLRPEITDLVIAELKDHLSTQLQDQLKALLEGIQNATSTQLRDDLTIQVKYFIAKLKEELLAQLKSAITVNLQDGLLTQLKTVLTDQLREGLGAQREQLNQDFERRRSLLEQQSRGVKGAAKAIVPSISAPPRSAPLTPKPTSFFQVRHPLHHLVLNPDGIEIDQVPPISISAPGSPARPSDTSVPAKAQRKQSWFIGGMPTVSSG
ncbi:hypothetical protein MKEN_00943300 [Mycena kentingensis (nom. inval.)]|nr:hypothetical protein MKEN_00943300 [Mycena kentingensis (nom. inval.)]